MNLVVPHLERAVTELRSAEQGALVRGDADLGTRLETCARRVEVETEYALLVERFDFPVVERDRTPGRSLGRMLQDAGTRALRASRGLANPPLRERPARERAA